MKRIIFVLLLSLAVSGCNSQNKGKIETTTAAPDSSEAPQVDIRVNKKYDSQGNLIQYDSTYSYFYKKAGGPVQRILSDSLFGQMRESFRQRYDSLFMHHFSDIFYRDSLLKYDFINRDYFLQRYELNRAIFSDLFREMDSLKSEMLRNTFPEGEMKRAPLIKPKD